MSTYPRAFCQSENTGTQFAGNFWIMQQGVQLVGSLKQELLTLSRAKLMTGEVAETKGSN
jgi:hypothetical protein